jgi:hypothetical protein
MNGDQMFEALAKAHPLVYTLPSTAEIDSFISQCFKSDKNNQDIEQESEDQEPDSPAPAVQEKYIKEITSVLERWDANILPRFVVNRLAFVFQNDEGFTFGGRDKDSSVPKEVRNLIQKMRLHMQKEKKKLLIG